MNPDKPALLPRIRLWLAVFMVGLVLSGATAFPLVHELRLLDAWFGESTAIGHSLPALGAWITKVRLALEENAWKHPFLAYGYDWLAFICGPIRGIPFYWTLIDCAFAVFGIIPLWLVRRDILRLAVHDPRWTAEPAA